MDRSCGLRYLLVVLLVLSLGFLLLHSSYTDRDIPSSIITAKGSLNIDDYFLTPFPNAVYGALFVALFLLAHAYLKIRLPGADPFVLPAVALLSGIGLIMMLRLSPDLAISRNETLIRGLSQGTGTQGTDNVLTFIQLGMKHFIHIGMGILTLVFAVTVPGKDLFSRLSSKKYLWVFLSAGLILATLLFGTTMNGRRLWFLGFQSVELVKLLVLFFVAGYVYEKKKGIELYRRAGFRYWIGYMGPFVLMWFLALIPLFVQRDLGPTVLIFTVLLLMFCCAGGRCMIAVPILLSTILLGFLSYQVGYPSIVRERFDMLLDPFGKSEAMTRVLWAVSSGGLIGSGIGYGQPHKIPEVQSDFNFSAICEEMGFVGGMSVLLGYALLLYRCFSVSMASQNIYDRTLAAGIGALIGMQAFIIICGNLNVIPLTGITLPFISYGGSSLIVNFLMIGIVLKISGGRG